MNPYDIESAFAEIENGIMEKLVDQFRKERPDGKVGSYEWKEWRVKQLKEIRSFIRELRGEYGPEYEDLNIAVSEQIALAFDEAIVKSLERQALPLPENSIFAINRTRMETLQLATVNDLTKVEGAVFRKVEDEYRKIIYKTHVALNSGMVTYDQAVDMATKDFINSGIECVEYKHRDKDGNETVVARHKPSTYAKMVLRTTMQRAGLMADGEIRQMTGVHTVYGVWRDMACPLCIPWLGRVMVDDVYGGGTKEDLKAIPKEFDAVMLSYAMDEGFLHPNCKDTIRTYDINFWADDPDNDPLLKTQREREKALELARAQERIESMIQNQKARAEKWERREKNSLSPTNRQEAKARKREALKKEKEIRNESKGN